MLHAESGAIYWRDLEVLFPHPTSAHGAQSSCQLAQLTFSPLLYHFFVLPLTAASSPKSFSRPIYVGETQYFNSHETGTVYDIVSGQKILTCSR